VAAPAIVELTNEPLGQLLEQVHDGRIQVPEFQRAVIWDDEGVRLLLASVSQSYPIGAVKLLQAGSSELRFECQPVAGAPPSSVEPERLLLDGQHRIAALYQVLASDRVVPIHDAEQKLTHRWYHVDIRAALDPDADRDDAIVSDSEAREELEWQDCLFPLRLVFGAPGELRRWQCGFTERGADRGPLLARFEHEVVAAFKGYVLPTINVGREWTRWAVRVHGGRDGRSLSDRFRVATPDPDRG